MNDELIEVGAEAFKQSLINDPETKAWIDIDGPVSSFNIDGRVNLINALTDALTEIQKTHAVVPVEVSASMLSAAEKCHGVIVDENGDYEVDIPAIHEALVNAAQGENQ